MSRWSRIFWIMCRIISYDFVIVMEAKLFFCSHLRMLHLHLRLYKNTLYFVWVVYCSYQGVLIRVPKSHLFQLFCAFSSIAARIQDTSEWARMIKRLWLTMCALTHIATSIVIFSIVFCISTANQISSPVDFTLLLTSAKMLKWRFGLILSSKQFDKFLFFSFRLYGIIRNHCWRLR